jgi:putative addiction module CopG family antidote
LLQFVCIQEISLMAVELAPQLEATIREKVQSGQYPDASAVIGEALALLDHRDRYARLRAAVAIGLEDAEAGRVRAWTPELLEELKREADEEDRLGLPISDDVQP